MPFVALGQQVLLPRNCRDIVHSPDSSFHSTSRSSNIIICSSNILIEKLVRTQYSWYQSTESLLLGRLGSLAITEAVGSWLFGGIFGRDNSTASVRKEKGSFEICPRDPEVRIKTRMRTAGRLSGYVKRAQIAGAYNFKIMI